MKYLKKTQIKKKVLVYGTVVLVWTINSQLVDEGGVATLHCEGPITGHIL